MVINVHPASSAFRARLLVRVELLVSSPPSERDCLQSYSVRENQGKTYLFRDGQGKSGRVRESQGIQRKSQGKVGKSQGDFFGKFLSPMNQDPLFFRIQSIFFKIQLRQVTCEILISAAELMFLCMYALGVHSSFCCWLILYCSFIF